MSVEYPTEVPVNEVQSLIKVVTGNTPFVLADAAHDAWVIQGYLQGLTLGKVLNDMLPEESAAAAATPALTDVETVAALQTLLPGDEGVKAQGLFNDKNFLTDILIQKLLTSLLAWLNEWLDGGGIEELLDKLKDVFTGGSEAETFAVLSTPLVTE